MNTQTEFNKSIIIYGCGGHARSLADVAISNGVTDIIFIDKNARENETLFGFRVLQSLPTIKYANCIVAIGENQQRAIIFETLKKQDIITLIAKNAYIGCNANVAIGTFVAQGAHLGPNSVIGENTIINTRSVIEHDCIVGNHSHISVNSVMAGKSVVGDFVMIGAGATVIDNIKICSHVVIGSGAVVVNDIDEPGVYVGVPAKKIK